MASLLTALILGACGGGGSTGGSNTTPPETTIVSQPAVVTKSDSATFTFSSTVAGSTFEYSLDGSEYVAVSSILSLSGLAGGTHQITVRAVTGGTPDPTPATVSWTIDITPPDTTIVSRPEVLTSSTSANFTFSSTIAGSTFEYSLDGGAYVAVGSVLALTGLADGAHQINVRAVAGGTLDQTPVTASWTIDTTLPDTTIVSRPAAFANSTSATFTFSSTIAGSTFEYSLDGGAYVAAGSTLSLTGLAGGAHLISVRAVVGGALLDPAPATANWTIDLTMPTAAIVFPTKISYTDANSITVRGSAADASGITSVSVNGVPAQTATAFSTWSASVSVPAGQSTVTVSVTDGAGNVAANADSVTITNRGIPLVQVRSVDVDAANNRMLVADQSLIALVAVDLTTGATSVLSDKNRGVGQNFNLVEGIVVDATHNRALVLDWGSNAIFSVSLTNGARTIVSAAGAANTNLSTGGIAVDSVNNIAYVTNADTATVIAVDLATGVRTVLSSVAAGVGTALVRPLDVVFDNVSVPATPRLLVADASVGVIAITLSSGGTNGDRAILSSASPIGTGTAIETPLHLRLDAGNNRVLVTDGGLNRKAVVAVNLTNGNRTVIADALTGSGLPLEFPSAIGVHSASARAYVAGSPGTEIVAIDLLTLNRTVKSGTNIGGGVKPIDLRGLERVGSTLIFLDSYRRTLNSVDLNTGDRTVISGPSIGTGKCFTTPQDLIVDAANQRAIAIDSGNGSVVSVNLANGDRTLVSTNGLGTGPVLNFPRGIANDLTSNRVLVTDSNLDAILAINMSTGDRTVLSSAGVGSGTAFNVPAAIAVDRITNPAAPRALVSDSQLFGIVATSLVNGDRSPFSTQSPFGSGISFLTPTDTWLDSIGQRLLVADANHRNLMGVSLATGNRVILSGRDSGSGVLTGSGPEFWFPWSVTADAANGVAYVASSDAKAIIAVDLITGNRVIVSR